VIFPALESSVVLPFSLVVLALLVVVTAWVVTLRRLREAEGGIAVRWLLLIVASFFFAAGSVLMSSPASDDAAGQCGASAADSANLPAGQTADINGGSCRTEGWQQVREAYTCLALGVVLSLGTVAATKRDPL
jgi:hypothetical protein